MTLPVSQSTSQIQFIMNERMMRQAGTAKSQPRLVCVLAASLAVSMCGLRGLVGSFLVSCPRGPPLQGR